MENENKRYTVIVSEKAAEMLVSHAQFLANVSEGAAKKLIEDFEIAANSLEMIPERNACLSNQDLPINKYRKLVFSKRYLMIYQIKKDRVYVDHIVDCRQNYGWLLGL
ncbi:MAG: plasmid stabilization system [Sporolactobacillus laevolacticus]|jgi:hypothetical protein|nr:plasmid stabilization system [Sporolactobacillus laevolacticus]